IGKFVSENPEIEISKTVDPQANAAGVTEITDAIEIAPAEQQQNLFSDDLKTFDPNERYTAVRLQQGRVQTDADFNEQHVTDTHLDDEVVIEFAGGDMRAPFITGDLWDFTDAPPEQQTASTDDPTSHRSTTDPNKP